MSIQSSHFRDLTARASRLRKHFLPKKYSPTGEYSKRVLDRASAYRLLVHAEIEFFIETISSEVVLKKTKSWNKSKKASNVIISLMAAYHTGFDIDEPDNELMSPKSRPKLDENVDKIIEKSTQQYLNKNNANNGIREKNIKTLFLPIGVLYKDLDSTWLADISSFGSDRGEVAHKSEKVRQSIDPKMEYDRVKNLLLGLAKLDRMILNIKK